VCPKVFYTSARLLQFKQLRIGKLYRIFVQYFAGHFWDVDVDKFKDNWEVLKDLIAGAVSNIPRRDRFEQSKARDLFKATGFVGQSSPELTETNSDDVPGDIVVQLGDGELRVHSQVLSLASPVFASMLSSGMLESRTGRIAVNDCSLANFHEFYCSLLPGKSRFLVISEKNVEAMLALSDFYQVKWVRQMCIDIYCRCPYNGCSWLYTVDRMRKFKTLGIKELYEHICRVIAYNFADMDKYSEKLKDDWEDLKKVLALAQPVLQRDSTQSSRAYFPYGGSCMYYRSQR
jgi:hypothetical protein